MQYSSQTGWWSVAIGKSIEWLCMEDCHSVKLSRLLALIMLVLNGSLFRNLTLVSYWAKMADELIACVTVHLKWFAMAATLHGGLLLEGN